MTEIAVRLDFDLPPITVTTTDYSRLMRTAQELDEQGHSIAGPLRDELRRATLCEPHDLPTDVITLNTFATYRFVGDAKVEKRMLIHPDDRMWPTAELSVLTPVGLALLGLRTGNRIRLIASDELSGRRIEIESVGPRVTDGIASMRSIG